MMFLVRGPAQSPPPATVRIKVARSTPADIAGAAGNKDYFCLGGPDDIAGLRAAGWEVAELRDGWYPDDSGGGVGIWGHGEYWEVRDTPFSVKESCADEAPAGAPATDAAAAPGGAEVDVRDAIFGV